ncbi:uncharacterized protein LOC135385896 isoform X2 [Ornithodoros turicata]|uniref:uncharacterized protein LOC135385896 isoform X2 n=1 Tax=Ornithodoros turicata TaxID=34597 RepID=UPI003139BEAF
MDFPHAVLWIAALLATFQAARSVVVTEVRLLSDSNKTQYVVQGEGAQLLCFFLLSPREDLRRVLWYKDGAEVYVWRKGRRPLARNLFEKRVDLNNRSPSFIVINGAHMAMQGNYTCKVETDLGVSQNDFFLTVIVDSCREDSWTTYSDRVACTETVDLDCSGMFPKPSPACGVYNERTGVYLNTVPFDRVDTSPGNATFDVRLHRVFQVRDWLAYRHLSFRCHIIVLGTDWRSGISHKLFGDAGCPHDPPEIVNGYYNITGEETCWRTPGEGSRVRYFCLEGLALLGPHELVCRNGSWVLPQIAAPVVPLKHILCEASGQPTRCRSSLLLTALLSTLPVFAATLLFIIPSY